MEAKNLLKEINKYPRDEKLSIPRRVAHCLNWCADHCPLQYVPFHILLKAIMGYARTPQPDSKEVLALRQKWTPVRKILVREYRRDLVVERTVGVRATTSSEDVAKTTLGARLRRFEGARKAVESTLSIVDPEQIRDRQLRAWVTDLRPVFAKLNSPDFAKKLLPPSEEARENERKK